MIKSTEEFGQALQQIIDRHRQDLSILLEGYGYDDNITPADLVTLYRANEPLLMVSMSNLPLDDEDLCHFEGESTLDKLKAFFSTGMDAFRSVKETADQATTSGSGDVSQPANPAPKTSKTKMFIIVGVVVAIALTVILISLKRKK